MKQKLECRVETIVGRQGGKGRTSINKLRHVDQVKGVGDFNGM